MALILQRLYGNHIHIHMCAPADQQPMQAMVHVALVHIAGIDGMAGGVSNCHMYGAR
jgi:hypothetical protein